VDGVVDRKIREYTKSHHDSVLANLTNGMNGGEAKYITAAMGKGDRAANKILIETSDNIALRFHMLFTCFHPKIIITGRRALPYW